MQCVLQIWFLLHLCLSYLLLVCYSESSKEKWILKKIFNIIKPNVLFPNLIFLWEFCPGQLKIFYFILMKLEFISQPSSDSTLPFAGLQHMQQCHFNFYPSFASILWSKWMVHEKWSPQWGFEPTTSQSWDFCLNH